MSDENSRLVYSTERTISRKGNPDKRSSQEEIIPGEQKINVRLERRGRGGKSVTVVTGLRASRKKRKEILKKLKAGLGTGGSLKEESMEIQGDCRSDVINALKRMGYLPKLS